MARKKSKNKDKNKTKKRLLRWKGCLANRSLEIRLITAAFIAISIVSFTFSQLGFVGIELAGDSAYAIVLLLPVALAAILLGVFFGTLMGLIAGIVLYYHASLMPLDFYELTFVTPLTSIVMFTVGGFMLGFLFSFALRNDPGPIKRAIYILLVCIIVSVIYSLGFAVNAMIALISEFAADGTLEAQQGVLSDADTNSIAQVVSRLGNGAVQAYVDAFLMAALCIFADIAERKLASRSAERGLKSLFVFWLIVVMVAVFMITAALCFVAITIGERQTSDEQIKGDVDYLCIQLEEAMNHADALEGYLESNEVDLSNMSDEQFDELSQVVSVDGLLDGYDVESDGIIVITVNFEDVGAADDFIMLSDDDRFADGGVLTDYFDDEIMDAIAKSIEADEIERIVYDEQKITVETLTENYGVTVKSFLAYLYAKQIDDYTVIAIMPASMVFASRASVMMWTTLSFVVILIVVSLLISRLLSRVVLQRINETNESLSRITQGDLSVSVDVRETREFESLSNGINETVRAMKGWISEAESRMDAELATAKEIQESALPRIFPPYPDILKFDIYAIMNAAREVGGDFYDFFLIGDDCDGEHGKLGFVIADVSGKGVPAALFMMKAKTQIRDYVASGMELGEAIENANRQLCDGNETGMFVTAFVGVLDYGSGHVDFVNAGHNPPLLWQETDWRWLTEKSGLPLGLFEGFPYQAYSVDCNIGDQFLIYTDGVTEAMDVNDTLYGEERLIERARMNYPLHPRELIESVRRDVAQHSEGAIQSDDITILALEVGVPPEITASLTVPADVNELPRVNEFIHTELDRRLCPLRVQHQLDIAVEELFVNVAHYAYPNATPENPGTAHVSYTYSADPLSITVDIIDDGIPYNPLAKPDAVTPDDIAEVPIGGLGILMAKRSVDEIRYERIDESNVVTIVKKW